MQHSQRCSCCATSATLARAHHHRWHPTLGDSTSHRDLPESLNSPQQVNAGNPWDGQRCCLQQLPALAQAPAGAGCPVPSYKGGQPRHCSQGGTHPPQSWSASFWERQQGYTKCSNEMQLCLSMVALKARVHGGSTGCMVVPAHHTFG